MTKTTSIYRIYTSKIICPQTISQNTYLSCRVLILSEYFLSTVFSSLSSFSHFSLNVFLSSINYKPINQKNFHHIKSRHPPTLQTQRHSPTANEIISLYLVYEREMSFDSVLIFIFLYVYLTTHVPLRLFSVSNSQLPLLILYIYIISTYENIMI